MKTQNYTGYKRCEWSQLGSGFYSITKQQHKESELAQASQTQMLTGHDMYHKWINLGQGEAVVN